MNLKGILLSGRNLSHRLHNDSTSRKMEQMDFSLIFQKGSLDIIYKTNMRRLQEVREESKPARSLET